jgi:hypothetical protein
LITPTPLTEQKNSEKKRISHHRKKISVVSSTGSVCPTDPTFRRVTFPFCQAKKATMQSQGPTSKGEFILSTASRRSNRVKNKNRSFSMLNPNGQQKRM